MQGKKYSTSRTKLISITVKAALQNLDIWFQNIYSTAKFFVPTLIKKENKIFLIFPHKEIQKGAVAKSYD